MNQTTLPFHLDEQGLRTFLENASSRKLSVIITDNSTTMLSIKEKKGAAIVRLHRMFLCAGSDVLNEIADYIKHTRKVYPLELTARGRLLKVRGISAVSNLNSGIADRQRKQAIRHLSEINIIPETLASE